MIPVPLQRASGYACDFQALRAQCSGRVKLVFLCSPNNPTGNRFDTDAIVALARDLQGRALLVVD